jgi:predicted outer membrane lipoprotein|tara:strand:+ start:648 stop:791 length:144 start_codon:yes stop_codon:yes gene_type:complete
MNKLKYILWLIGIVAWNFGVPAAKPAYDVIAALCLKHIVDLDKLFSR